MYLIAIVAALAGLLFGYDAGIISGAMLFIRHSFPITDTSLGLVVSAVPIGALVAAALCGRASDWFGRKRILIMTAILYLAGSILSGLAWDLDTLVVARLILGVAVGLGSYSAPMYIAEIAKQDNRGALVTLNQLAITIGIMLSYLIDYIFSYKGEWRYMLGAGFIPAFILFVCVIFLPESPRWLVLKGRLAEAKAILQHIHGANASHEFRQIQSVVKAKTLSFWAVLTSQVRRVLLLGILVSVLTQAVGINAIIYYAPAILKLAGLTKATVSILATTGIGLVNVLFTFIAIKYLDQLGRRLMLLGGVSGIILSLIIATVAFAFGVTSVSLAWVIVAAFAFFVACQAIGTGPACWLIPSEIFPTESRGVGMGVSVAFNWAANVLVAFCFPIVIAHLGAAWMFGIFLVIALIAFVLFYQFVPETKNVSLEHIEENIYAGLRLRDLGANTGSSVK